MRVGYARVRPDPRAQGQQESLSHHDISRFYFDLGRTGVNLSSDELDAAAAAAGSGGELVVTRLSRLARSLAELGQVLFMLAEMDIALRVGSAVFNLRSADQLLVERHQRRCRLRCRPGRAARNRRLANRTELRSTTWSQAGTHPTAGGRGPCPVQGRRIGGTSGNSVRRRAVDHLPDPGQAPVTSDGSARTGA